MADRLTDAFNMLRQGGAIYAGRARLTNWSDNARGMNASFRLDASADPLENPATNPFKGAHCSPKDGHEFMVLVIPVAPEAPAKPEPHPCAETMGGCGGCYGEGICGLPPIQEEDEPDALPAAPPSPPAERRKITDLPFSQRAALLCQEKLFPNFIADRFPDHWDASGLDAVKAFRRICGVESRAELNKDADAAQRFDRLRRDYYAWTQEPVA
ncbi:hypothetical protein Sp245p_03330 [Azospirillum baldaniorum]|nr:hypothetical protein [Azospirillum baldaniorum]AWJ88887.1 hypothetical protein Sp245p_03330 [Azospirillum baldaniorum]TWA73404.1 hypothetical protein FBZ85_11696 [Azospirillum brasilense]